MNTIKARSAEVIRPQHHPQVKNQPHEEPILQLHKIPSSNDSVLELWNQLKDTLGS